jgi:hypothetical protein
VRLSLQQGMLANIKFSYPHANLRPYARLDVSSFHTLFLELGSSNVCKINKRESFCVTYLPYSTPPIVDVANTRVLHRTDGTITRDPK